MIFYRSAEVNARSCSGSEAITLSAAPSDLQNLHNRRIGKKMLALWAASLACAVAVNAQQRAIDTQKSVMTVRVYKAGMFSALGHDHEISAPIERGMVDTTARRVELHIKAGALRVQDRGVSEKDRTEIQSTMLGPEVLDAESHPEIAFQSTRAEPINEDSWRVVGDLTLRGQTQPVTVEVRKTGDHYVGSSRLKQTEFGIKPVKVAGGTVRVKDEIRIEFDIQLAR
jgi:polyisoprenoid-binding protein YceI